MTVSLRQSMLRIILLGFFLARSDAGFRQHKAYVQITNNIGPGIELTYHCKSADDDLGERKLANGAFWGFSFRPNFWGTTQYYCSFAWPGQFQWFDIFITKRDYRDYGNNFDFLWSIVPTGPCRYNIDSKKYDICFPWNKPDA
ncbi:hypothetical protein SLA2020_212280 [Shorea laevis]